MLLACSILEHAFALPSKFTLMDKTSLFLLALLLQLQLAAQTPHLDFIGAGHDNQVLVSTSSSSSNNSGQKTVDGFPIQNTDQLKDASRFLAQATFGADYATIQMTAAMGYSAWLDEQFSLPQISVLHEMTAQSQSYEEGDEFNDSFISHLTFRTAWVTNNLTSPDLLRQRMAFNLSQIMVVNDNSDFFNDAGNFVGAYYDLLSENAFGNYQKLLTDVTLSPAMGVFLSHYNNPKANPAQNIHPDENYAREIMQLFSIGLWQLHPNGTRIYDDQGQFIPTYTNADIKEFAQVFTGLSAGVPEFEFGADIENAEEDINIAYNPMIMHEEFHDISEKHLLNGVVLPANQSGMEDINQTIAHLSSHPNTAPFISKALIKMLTTSNPSPGYVQDVASVFNPSAPNNFQEVIRAILLHPQARNCNLSESYTFGKLREPIVRMLNYLKAFQLTPNENLDYLYPMDCLSSNIGQVPMNAPSVFNFFLPDYQPPGPISQNYYVAPEFQILNSTNAIGIINDVHRRTIDQAYLSDICIGDEEEEEDDNEEELGNIMDYTAALDLIGNLDAFIDHLDILLANGLLQDDTKTIIKNAISGLNEPNDQLKMALYLILISPDYAILK